RSDSGAVPVRIYTDETDSDSNRSRRDPGEAVDEPRRDIGALLLSDGRVLSWYQSDAFGNLSAFSATPQVIPGITDIVDIGVEREYLLLLRRNGTVWEYGRSTDVRDPAGVISAPTQIAGLSGIVELVGRVALRNDGRVFVIPQLRSTSAVSTPLMVPDLMGVTSLLDSKNDVALLSDGRVAYWRYDESTLAPLSPDFADVEFRGPPSDVQDSLITDSACGRVWRVNSPGWSATFPPQPGELQRLDPRPLVGFGGASRCDNGDQSHLIFFAFDGEGDGVIQSSSGSVECLDGRIGSTNIQLTRYCWWFGENDTQPQFTAIPDEGSVFREWAWDCESTTNQSARVTQAPDTSQNLCRVRFEPGDSTDTPPEPVMEWRLEVQATGLGSVRVDPEPNRQDNVGVYFDDGTEVTLTAIPADDWIFSNWDEGDCTNDTGMPEITVIMDADILCIANFERAPQAIAPVGRITVSPSTVVDANTLVTFDASTSSDADGMIVSYDWDFDGDGVTDASGEVVSTTFTTPGINDVLLTVTDNDALQSQAAVGITVRPPVGGMTFDVQVSVRGSGQVTVDPIARTLPDSECDGEDCLLSSIAQGTRLTLVASPFTPAAFTGWDVNECDELPNADTCVVVVNSNRAVVAQFQ
ncbi:MAG: PKD domain-containing protein, partial [Pseudomonadota bacterium]